MQKTLRRYGKAAVSILCAGALAGSMFVGGGSSLAYAADRQAMSAEGYVSCSPTPWASSLPEFLGMNTTDERWGIDDTNGQSGVLYNNIQNTSGALRYLLMGTDEYNENPDPLMYNTIYDTNGQKVIQNSSRSAYKAMNRNRALGFYGSADSDTAIWDMEPDVILGVLTDDGQTDYSAELAAMKESYPEKFADYNPIAVNLTSWDAVEVLYDVADAADQVVANSNGTKKLRYGNATELVKNYESIITGSQGYVLYQLNKNNAEKKTVAYVTANDGEKVTLSTSFDDAPVAASLSNVAVNYVAGMTPAEGEEGITFSISDFISRAKDIDFILLNTDDNYADGDLVAPTGLESLSNKMYWVSDSDCGTIGSDKKGPDFASNYCRVMGCLYPEYIDQSDWVAYYYDTVYHVKDNKIADAVSRAMDGVRNWDVQSGSGDDYLQWDTSTVAGYSQSEVASLIQYGMAYVKSDSSLSSAIPFTDELAGDVADISKLKDPSANPPSTSPAGKQEMYRLYNPNSGEHFYTKDSNEKNHLASIGWNDEGTGWTAPSSGDPVYRLYNPNAGEHHYTTNAAEKDSLVNVGWQYEDIGWYSDTAKTVEVYRLYNPNEFSNNHHYTLDVNEKNDLVNKGWQFEGVGWYGV